MSAYYNEIDPEAAETLRNLIDMGLIAPGDVDTRDIRDVAPSDLDGYSQCHFFAGIGIWSLALRNAGVRDDSRVWTGSCPCQPFSAAGARAGIADERHLWPHWQWLIAQCAPEVVFGEQVASKDGLGWLDLVQADMEGTGYAFVAEDRCAAGYGAPHIRQRLWFGAVRLADADDPRRQGWHGDARGRAGECAVGSDGVVNRLEHDTGNGRVEGWTGADWRRTLLGCRTDRTDPYNTAWRDPDWLWCRDDKFRPVEPGTFPLAHGLPAGLGKCDPRIRVMASMAGLDADSLRRAKRYRTVALRCYGNAIVEPVARAWITDFFDALA